MAEGGRILVKVLKEIAASVKPGIATKDLNALARKLISSHGAEPSFLGHDGFPAAICVSVNDEVVHGVPSERILKEGDILGLDIGIKFRGFHTDGATTLPVLGLLSEKQWQKNNPVAFKLINVTREALALGIKEARPGNRLGEIGHVIQRFVEKNGFNVVRDLAGHGIGRRLHEEPNVPNFGDPGEGVILESGMVLAIEPMVTEGDWRIKKGHDGFVFITQDGKHSAHFEHTIAITKRSPKILTK